MTLLIHIPSQKNPISPSDYASLTYLQKKELKLAMAQHSEASEACLSKLSNDANLDIRKAVATNPNTPEETLQDMAKDCSEIEEWIVENNSNAPLSLLVKYANSDNKYTRGKAARNPKCPLCILEKLAEDPDDFLKSSVLQNPNCPLYLLKSIICLDDDILKAIHPNADQYLLATLSRSQKIEVIIRVASNPVTSNDILVDLAVHRDPEVRKAVTQNINAAPDIVELASHSL